MHIVVQEMLNLEGYMPEVYNEVPASYDELFDCYFDYVKGLVKQFGIRENEDVAQEIILRFYARDFLVKYDPSVVSHGKNTNFRAFLRSFTERYSRHYRERQGIRDHREPVVCDMTLQSGSTWIETYGSSAHASESLLVEEQELVLLMRDRVMEMPTRGRRDYVKLFDMLIPMVRMHGKVDRQELAKQYGVSATVIADMLKQLKGAMSYLDPVQ